MKNKAISLHYTKHLLFQVKLVVVIKPVRYQALISQTKIQSPISLIKKNTIKIENQIQKSH